MRKNFQFSIFNFQLQKGFTLIELLAVMVVLIAVGGLIGAIFFSSLRGTNKVNNLTIVRQTGNITILQMTKLLRFAKDINTPATCTSQVVTSSVTVTALDDTQVTLACTGNPTTIASNGASLIDTSMLSVSDCYFTCSQLTAFVPPTITINFTLAKRASNSLVETQASIPFHSRVLLQNIR